VSCGPISPDRAPQRPYASTANDGHKPFRRLGRAASGHGPRRSRLAASLATPKPPEAVIRRSTKRSLAVEQVLAGLAPPRTVRGAAARAADDDGGDGKSSASPSRSGAAGRGRKRRLRVVARLCC